MYKKILISFFIILFALPTFAQTDQDDIRETLNSLLALPNYTTNNEMFDYVYPKLFEYVPREALEKMMDKVRKDTLMVITTVDPKTKQISRVIKFKDVKYAIVSYSFTMVMKMPMDEDGAGVSEFMIMGFNSKYGAENVNYEQANNTFYIKFNNEMYAIKDPAYEGWKILEKKEDPRSQALFKMMFSKKVVKKLSKL